MTLHQEPEHCNHECVCPDYFDYNGVKLPCDGILMPDFGKREKCKHDTRSCPHNPALHMGQCDDCLLKGLRLCMYSGYPENTIPPICDYRIVDIDRDEYCIQQLRSRSRNPSPETRREFLTKQNIEQFKEQEREKVLDELTALIDNSKEYGSQDRMELFHYTGLNGMIDSLRNKEQP